MADASVWISALSSVAIVSLISFVGALTLTLRAFRRHSVLLVLVAFAAGALIGDAFFHLLPEGADAWGGFTVEFGFVVICGFLAFYLLEVGLRWGHAHGEEAHPHSPLSASERPAAPFAWTNLVGDGIHNFVDGVVLGAIYLSSPALGVAATIAVAAHEIPQELGDFAVLKKAGFSNRRALFYNFLSALVAVLGTVVVLVLPESDLIERYGVPITAGGFLYIAAADLIPELHHHVERRFVPLIMMGLVAGLGAMALLLRFEIGA